MVEPQSVPRILAAIELIVELLRDLVLLALIYFMARWTNNVILDVIALLAYGAVLAKYIGKMALWARGRFEGTSNKALVLVLIGAAIALMTFALSMASNALVAQLTEAVVEIAKLTR